MKNFRDLIVESPVGQVGRTRDSEALDHIENTDVASRFKKIVKELGGKQVAKQLLMSMGKSTVTEAQSIEAYLRSAGYKIKAENPTKKGKELEFYKSGQAEVAFDDLKSLGFMDNYTITLDHNYITYSV